MGRGPSIEGRKNAADAQRAKIFTKLIREITLAARASGGDPAGNPRLRLAMDKALSANMPKDKIDTAIKRGSGELGADQQQEVRYEGYGPGGVAIMVDCVTDNPVRTVAEVRHAFSKHGGNMGTSGSVAFQFSPTGQLWFELGDGLDEEALLEQALEAGADDVVSVDGFVEVLTAPEQFQSVRDALKQAGFEAVEGDVVMRAANAIAVAGEQAVDLQKLLDRLDELDDVQKVVHNADLPG